MPHKVRRRDLELLRKELTQLTRKQQQSLSREGQIELAIRDFRKAESAKRRAERERGPRYTFEQLEKIKREGEKMIKERQLAAAKVSVESPPRYRRGCITELGVCITERGICRRTGVKSTGRKSGDCGLKDKTHLYKEASSISTRCSSSIHVLMIWN
jgi:hypothetical protein